MSAPLRTGVPLRLLRCTCSGKPLGSLLTQIRDENLQTVAEVAAATGCGLQCGACRPYIARMLETGDVPTIDKLLSGAELERYRAIAGPPPSEAPQP